MSSDQRPGKVRVFSSGTMAELPRRRREDYADLGSEPVTPAAKPPAELADKPAGFASFGLLAGLFLLGCAGGGALLAWLGLMPGGSQ